jgi:argininosuccinate lyase
VTAVIGTLRLNPEAMRAALTEDMLATDLADYLVARGLPFRQAHHIVGQVVQEAARQQAALSALPLETLKGFSDLFDAEVIKVFDFDAAVARRKAVGGTAPEAVLEQIKAAKARVGERV